MLSIDIGKKNLGYTYFELDDEDNVISIHYDIYNIDENISKRNKASKSVVKDVAKDVAKEVVKDVAKDVAKEVVKDVAKDVAKEVVKDVAKDVAKEVVKDVAKEVVKEVVKDVTKDVVKDSSKNLGKDVAKDVAKKDSSKNLGRDVSKNVVKKGAKSKDVVTYRCTRIKEFFDKILSEYKVLKYVVIERQVPRNTVAMNLMYGINAYAQIYTDNIFIFDPKMKFTKLGVSYNTQNKAHKILSIDMAKKIMNSIFPDYSKEIDTYEKQDDIADSFNQGMIHGIINKIFNNYQDLSVIKELFK